MDKYEVIVEILGKKYKCKVSALDKIDAWTQARKLMCDKIRYVDADIVKEEPIQEVVDFDNLFSSIFSNLKPGQR